VGYIRGPGDRGDTELSHLQPKIKVLIAPVYKKFGGKVIVQEVLVAANKRWEDLPILPRAQCKIMGKNKMCWNYLCGSCKWGKNCMFARNHLPNKEVDDKFAEDVVKALKRRRDEIIV
jgi:hypothetical protein